MTSISKLIDCSETGFAVNNIREQHKGDHKCLKYTTCLNEIHGIFEEISS
jgi:hypothetical protein